MRFSPVLESCRRNRPPWTSKSGDRFGLFDVPFRSAILTAMACDAGEEAGPWEHVSVSLPNRCPNWEEMSFIKSLFWGPDETVIQFHPRESDYVNIHPHCLHLWRRVDQEYELPPRIMV